MSYNGRYWVKNTDITWRKDSTPIIRKMAVALQCGETSLYPGRSVTVAGKVKGNIGGNLLQSARELSLGVWFPSKTRTPITNPELLEVPQTGNSQSTCKVTSGCEHFCKAGWGGCGGQSVRMWNHDRKPFTRVTNGHGCEYLLYVLYTANTAEMCPYLPAIGRAVLRRWQVRRRLGAGEGELFFYYYL